MRRVLIACALLSVAPAVVAQTDDEKNTARDFGKQGQDALDHGDGKTAEDDFHRAVQIFDNAKAVVPPTLLLGYARGAAKNNHFIAAEETYNRIIRAGLPPGAPPVFAKALDDAKREIDAVSPHIAHATISVTGCDNPSVTLDGAPLPSVVLGAKKPVDPGSHEVKATAAGCKASSASFTVGDGAETTSTLTLEKDPSATVITATPTTTVTPTTTATITAPSNQTPGADTGSSGSGLRTAGLAITVTGGVALGLGIAMGIYAISKHSDLTSECPGGVCPATDGAGNNGTLNDYHIGATVSTVGFIAGPVLLAAGITMMLLAPSKKADKAAWITPVIGLGSLGAVGRF